jgi:hypothetical protein
VPERDGYPAGVPCWVDTSQPDPEAATRFYGGLFGWEFENVMPEGHDGEYFFARIRGKDVAAISYIPEDAPQVATWNTYIAVDSADDAASKVRDAGGEVIMEPFDVMDAGRMAGFADPEGAIFYVWQAGRTIGSQIVNEHGSVNFNNLNTHDVESAKRFYGAVFGWTMLDLGGGGQMWTLPGYGDYLEQKTPGLLKDMEEMGAPPGFADVVAAIVPIPEDQPDARPHWSVTFATDDADASAEKASELGGTVVASPFDAPWVRMTVIADPQGASFIASQFVMENRDVGQPA